MKVEIPITIPLTQICEINMDELTAYRILCKILGMDFVLDEDRDFYVSDNGHVWETVNGHDTEIDERGDLFIALRNVAANIFPNTLFRSADYIYERKCNE